MRKHPKAFDDLYTNMIAAGEAGGILDTILKRLATYIEKNVKLKAQVKGAMVYPVAVISIAGIVIAVILWKVIPTFAAMFAGLGRRAAAPHPVRDRARPTGSSGCCRSSWWAACCWWSPSGATTPPTPAAASWTGCVLKAPIFGTLMRKIAVARFCRTLSTLISSGVPILDGLEITARTAGNAIVEDAIMSVRKGVEGGLTIAQPLKESGVFPPMVVQMIGVGEQTGALDAMLSKIADFYEEEVDQAVANLLTLMEPVMILFLGDLRRRHHHRDVPAALRPHQQAVLMPARRHGAGRKDDVPHRGSGQRGPDHVRSGSPRGRHGPGPPALRAGGAYERRPGGPPQAADAVPGGHGDHPAVHRHLRRGGLRDAPRRSTPSTS